jgi:AraC-like DNA-binding protein
MSLSGNVMSISFFAAKSPYSYMILPLFEIKTIQTIKCTNYSLFAVPCIRYFMKNPPALLSTPTYAFGDIRPDVNCGKNIKNFRIYDIDENAKDDGKINKPIKLDHFLIGLMIEGEGDILFNLIPYNLHRNSLFIVTPNIHITFQGHRADSKIMAMNFTPDFLMEAGIHKRNAEIFNYADRHDNPHFSLTDNEVKILKASMFSMKESALSEESHYYKTEVLHHEFNVFLFELASILKKYRVHECTKLTRKEDILNVFTNLLTIHFREERSVQYYADAMFLTPNHLSKTIKELTNKPSRDLIDAMVIVEAKVLLDDAAHSINNVAELLHFSNQFFFSKFFKNNTGINPSQYKNRV